MATQSVPENEWKLIREALKGSGQAFNEIYREHKSRVFSLCTRMVWNLADAEELTQEVFLHVSQKLAQFKGHCRLGTWVYRIAVNTVLMRLRKHALQTVSLDDPPGTCREYNFASIRDPRFRPSTAGIELERAIQQLAPSYRRIFVMHDIEGHDHRTIAKTLGCTMGNSKSQLHKARKRLKLYLEGKT